MAKFIDATGSQQEVALSEHIYHEAEDKGMRVDDYINMKYPTKEGQASAFDQMVASLGISFQTDRRAGTYASKLNDVLKGTTNKLAISNTAPGGGTPESALIFPVAVLSAIEDKLNRDLTTAANAFESLIAFTENINGQTFQRIITNFAAPENARNGATAQLARPQNFALLTAAPRPGVVPIVSLGLEWADQVLQNTTIDFIALSLARQIAMQRNADAQDATIALLNGDEDLGQGPIPAAYRKKAVSYDPTITEAGEITHKAWVKWLYDQDDIRRIDYIITDIDTAIAIENRKGKPVIVGDDPNSPRINTEMRVANPLIPAEVKVFVTRHPDWPTGTILGMHTPYAIQRVVSLSANYNATDRDPIRRANAMRWDSGSVCYRLHEEAFAVLELAL